MVMKNGAKTAPCARCLRDAHASGKPKSDAGIRRKASAKSAFLAPASAAWRESVGKAAAAKAA